ncbi:MAG: hypothetical protein QGG36_24475 [Pirellulaceae bacterium]|jgi:transcriptional regulator with XRE-family HTH domain|nr:hypothetical protein [Pirellulaceae bacterium]MDP7018975.1 hypothetical protein [Pirellulaceae bacterium]
MGATIDRLFEQSTIPLEDLISHTGLAEERVKAILEGRWLPSPKERELLAAAFNVTVDDVDWGHTMSPRNVRYHRFGLPEDFK